MHRLAETSPEPVAPDLGSGPPREALLAQYHWLVGIRWVASLASELVFGLAMALGIVDFSLVLLSIPVLLAVANVVFWQRGGARGPTTLNLERAIVAQVALDLAFLATVLQLGGGGDNPMEVLLVLPPAIAGMLLPVRSAVGATAFGLGVHVLLVFAEFRGWIAHHPLRLGAHEGVPDVGPYLNSPGFVAAHLGALLLVVAAVLFFVCSLVTRTREAEARRLEHERIAAARAPFARIGALAAGVAHTVRNPLHGLGNCVDMLRARAAGSTDPEEHEILALMDEGVHRIATVTDRLLVLTRNEPPRRSLASLDEVVREALRFLDPTHHQRGIEVRLDLPPLPQVRLDRDRICEALANVVDNAIAASPVKGSVVVRASDGRPSREVVRIEVQDDGPGIPENLAHRVFDPFFTTKPLGEGTGLGLAIAKRIVEDHGGTIMLSRARGHGTVVCIELPLTPAGSSTA